MPISFSERLELRKKKAEQNVPWWVNDKIKLGEFCRENDIPFPHLLKVWSHPDQIDLSEVPDDFVLKPHRLHSGWGVMVLTKTDTPGRFFDSITQAEYNLEEILVFQTKIYNEKVKDKNGYRLMIEEKVVDYHDHATIPLDYKVFSFHGVPKLIIQYDRNTNPRGTAFFDGEFRPLILQENLMPDFKKVSKGEHLVPADWRSLLEISNEVTRKLETPFMRVDMFASKRGPILGELTPAPGGPNNLYRFTSSFELELGTAWAEAEARLS